MLRLAILISGRGSNMRAILDAIRSGRLNAVLVVVVSSSPDAGGLSTAREMGIPTAVLAPSEFGHREDYCDALSTALAGYRPDLIVLAGFMVVLKGRLLREYQGQIVNIHPSLLPAFPGAHAHRDALRYGAKVTGCTVHFVDDGVDSGPVILQEAVDILPDDDEETLAARVLLSEHRIYPIAIQWIAQGRLAMDGRRVRVLESDIREGCSR